jgi:F-type H+-transporting ATPase subunit b
MLSDPTFWVATAFVAFIGLLIYLKVPGTVGNALDKRAQKIKADLDEAEALCTEAQDLLATYQKKQRDTAKEAEAIAAHAKEEAARILEQGRVKLEDSLARREKLALDRIAQAEAAAIDEVRDRTVEIAMDATRQVMSSMAAAGKADGMIDDAIADLPGKLH